jgi:hypothetical protein
MYYYNLTMYYNDNCDPANENNFDKNSHQNDFDIMLEKTKKMDKGYNQITIKYLNHEGKKKNKKIDVYTSSGYGNLVRDAETGTYYTNKVGTLDEDLFFKVSFATGELKSYNDSNALFYISPYNFMKHLMCEVSQDTIKNWETKRDARLKQLNTAKSRHLESIVVN